MLADTVVISCYNIYVYHINMLYTLNIHNVLCYFCLNESRRKQTKKKMGLIILVSTSSIKMNRHMIVDINLTSGFWLL